MYCNPCKRKPERSATDGESLQAFIMIDFHGRFAMLVISSMLLDNLELTVTAIHADYDKYFSMKTFAAVYMDWHGV
jgi:hypothetical protein